MKNIKSVGLVFIASILALSACGDPSSVSSVSSTSSTSSVTDPSIPDVPPVVASLEDALAKDYSNATVVSTSYYKASPEDLEVSTYSSEILYYDGYSIVYDEMLAQMGMPAYWYYHDYNGENYMYFDGNESSGERDGWLKDNGSGVEYALRYTEFYLPDFLTKIDPSKATLVGGSYFIMDEVEVARLNVEVFQGVWDNDIQSVAIILSNEGYVSKIYAYEEIDNDEEFFVAEIGRIGETIFNDDLLPEAPNADNTLEFWEYKGWAGPDRRVYPSAVTLQATNESDRVEVKELEIEKYFEVEYSLSWPALEGEYHFTKRESVSWVSSDETVARHAYVSVDVPQVDSLGRELYLAGDRYVAKEGEKYYTRNLTGEENEVDVTGLTLVLQTKSEYRHVIQAVGEGEATIKVIASSARDDEEFNSSPKHGVQSNEIKVRVNGLAPINKENAVYNFDFVSLGEADEDGNKVVNANNKIVAYSDFPFSIKANGASFVENKYSELFNGSGSSLYLAPSTNMNARASVSFDFGVQQVSSVAFNYGYWMQNDKNGAKPDQILVRTSNDGATWTTTDITAEILENISGINLKNIVVEFAAASMVEIFTHCPMIGGAYSFKMVINDITFSKDETCHDYVAPGSEVLVESIAIGGPSKVRLGEQASYSAVVNPTNATDKSVTWVSTNTSVATISNEGVVTPLTVGNTIIRATSNDGSEVVSNDITLVVEETLNLPAKYDGLYQDDFYYSTYSFTFDSVAMKLSVNYDYFDNVYNADLYLSDKGEGEQYHFTNSSGDVIVITFQNNGASGYVSTGNKSKLNGNYLAGVIDLTKRIDVTSISLTPNGLEMNSEGKYEIIESDSVFLSVTKTPNEANYGLENLSWSLNNESIAKIDEETKKFTALSAGEVSLTVTSDDVSGVSDTIVFVIKAPVLVSTIAISGATNGKEVTESTTLQLGYITNPSVVDKKNIVWSSSDTKIASVTQNGLVNAKKTGNVTIRVEDTISGAFATVDLVVVAAAGEATVPELFYDYYGYGSYGEEITFNEDGTSVTLIDMIGMEIELEFTGEFGELYNGTNPSYRYASADETLVVDITIYNDTIEVYIIDNTSDLYFDGDYVTFEQY